MVSSYYLKAKNTAIDVPDFLTNWFEFPDAKSKYIFLPETIFSPGAEISGFIILVLFVGPLLENLTIVLFFSANAPTVNLNNYIIITQTVKFLDLDH